MADEVLYTWEDQVDPNHTAVIVIDIQNDFLHPDGYLAKFGHDIGLGQAIIPRLSAFIETARNAGTSIVFVRVILDAKYRTANWEAMDRKRQVTVERCILGSWGADYYELQPLPTDLQVIKHTYSAFYDTDLNLLLRARGIKTLVMTGTHTNVGVESTARDGFFLGYYVVLVSDCTAATLQDAHDATVAEFNRSFGWVSTADQLEAHWEKRAQG